MVSPSALGLRLKDSPGATTRARIPGVRPPFRRWQPCFDLVTVSIRAIEGVRHFHRGCREVSDDETDSKDGLREIGAEKAGGLDVGQTGSDRLVDRAKPHPETIAQELEQRDSREMTRADALAEARPHVVDDDRQRGTVDDLQPDQACHRRAALHAEGSDDVGGGWNSLGGDDLDLRLIAEDQAALVTFNHVVFQGSGLTSNLEHVRTAIDRMVEPGETSLVDGIYTGMMIGESDVGRSLLIVFSDGFDTTSWLSADSVLDTAKRADAVVYTVAVGTSPKATFLRDLSALTGGTFFRAESTTNLRATFLRILDEFRHRYLVSYSPRDVVKGGWHKLEVRVKRKGVTVKARPGYLAN